MSPMAWMIPLLSGSRCKALLSVRRNYRSSVDRDLIILLGAYVNLLNIVFQVLGNIVKYSLLFRFQIESSLTIQ